MTAETIPFTLDVPEVTFRRLESTAQAMRRSLQEIMVHTLNVGSPPTWGDVPAEYQTELAVMDRMEDEALWAITRGHKSINDMDRYDELLYGNQNGGLSPAEQLELQKLRTEAELFMLRKAHAAALLRWRGHIVPRT